MREFLGGAGGRGRLGGQVGGERGTCGLGLGEAGGERGIFGFELTEAGLEFGGRAGRGLGGGDGGGEVVALLGEDGIGAESDGEFFLGVGPGLGGAPGFVFGRGNLRGRGLGVGGGGGRGGFRGGAGGGGVG